MHIAIGDIAASHLVGTQPHDLIFHLILNLLHIHGAAHVQTIGFHIGSKRTDLLAGKLQILSNHTVGFGNGENDFGNIKIHFAAVALDNFHKFWPLDS